MPELVLPKSLIQTAKNLLPPITAAPSEADLRRSISTAYFAAYHALAQTCADSLIGEDKASRPNRAWIEVYRGLSHGTSKDACAKAKSVGFPEEVEGFADTFVQLQHARKRVDYDPTCQPSENEAAQWVAISEVSVNKLENVDKNSKLAFSTWVLISSPGTAQARTAAKDNVGPELGAPNGC
ncbi:hypothetical protein [Tritonibacter mobilis]|uniref:hypothetical protein n=1 Tax=Tritonibacter mobilis TaxID=379347 RepID=UPI00140325B0|nr:hypothetical protein [Tritonibacter mobilis]NHM18855.1 hypothetical protein [Tritonibacter mobilis]NHM22951.1 hypothetical protein [Tritonibacter mobilis]